MQAYVSAREQLMVEVYVRNLQTSSEFYRRFGFEVVSQEGAFMTLKWENIPLAIKEMPSAPPPLPYPVCTLRIMVPNVDTYWQLAQQMDASVLWPIADREYGLRDFAITGPDGVGLCFATCLADLQNPDKG
jgi:catechol 2,3-dioxygenase-like lactoylglutathione lyase family enzyme